MPYTPVELRHVRVGRALLGYRREAVESLLAEIADSFETVWRERHQLADHSEEIERELQDLRAREQALTQTLVAAEQAATHVKEQAKREAEGILAEAHSEARAVTRTAQVVRERLYAEARRTEGLLRAARGTRSSRSRGSAPTRSSGASLRRRSARERSESDVHRHRGIPHLACTGARTDRRHDRAPARGESPQHGGRAGRARRPRERQPPRRHGGRHVRPRARRGPRGGSAADARPDRRYHGPSPGTSGSAAESRSAMASACPFLAFRS